VGTAPLNRELHAAFEDHYGIALYESYGLSETLFISTQSPGADGGPGAVGPVLDGVGVHVADDRELHLRAPWMFRGYLDDGTSDADRTSFASGDLGDLDRAGALWITGRKKELIIRGGVNVSPRQLEDFISGRRVLDQAIVVGCPDAIMGERIVCFYVPREGGFGSADRRALVAAIRNELGAECTIDDFVEVEDIPQNVNGKVDRLKLKQLYESARA
jgi:long-chain acyl-CoA synthetase